MRDARPILFLVFLTPCVEFLTGSTSLGAVLTVPSAAFTFFLLTWPSYALPVLLIREAIVAWNKWIASLLALGIAYGALNEGLLAKTYFVITPTSPPLGGGVGHWLGVNWPWVTGITLFHMVVSISVPVVLSFLIWPETRERRFLSDRTIRVFFALILFEVLGILTIQSLFSPAARSILPLILLPAAIVVLGVYLARRLPRPNPNRVLTGRAARSSLLILAAVLYFVILFIPILWAFPLPFIPITQLYDWLYRAGTLSAVIATVYPLVFAAMAIRFFGRYSLTDRQTLAIVTGVMLIPLTTALAVHDIPVGDWAAAGVYIAAIVIALRRIQARERSVPPQVPISAAAG